MHGNWGSIMECVKDCMLSRNVFKNNIIHLMLSHWRETFGSVQCFELLRKTFGFHLHGSQDVAVILDCKEFEMGREQTVLVEEMGKLERCLANSTFSTTPDPVNFVRDMDSVMEDCGDLGDVEMEESASVAPGVRFDESARFVLLVTEHGRIVLVVILEKEFIMCSPPENVGETSSQPVQLKVVSKPRPKKQRKVSGGVAP